MFCNYLAFMKLKTIPFKNTAFESSQMTASTLNADKLSLVETPTRFVASVVESGLGFFSISHEIQYRDESFAALHHIQNTIDYK